jgi:polyisoprenyl-phosphate glycosyltransferase
MKQFSVILPLMNEEAVLGELYARVKKTMDSLGDSYEIIFVDDGSTDSTGELIGKYGGKDPNILGVRLSKNFGQDNAISAGLSVSEGQNIILLDGDLQDPPEVIPNLIHEKHKGYDVVYGIKTDRKEGIVIKGLTAIFYQFMFFLSGIRMPRNVGTFSIFTRQVGDAILQFPESNKFFSGLRYMAGFKQTGVNYKRAGRIHGDSKSLIALARMAMNAIFSNAIFPMRIVIFFSSIVAFLAGFTGLFYFYQAIEGPDTISNLSFIFQPLVILILSVVLLILVVIAEVVSRIDFQVKKRPDFIIKSITRNGVVENVQKALN